MPLSKSAKKQLQLEAEFHKGVAEILMQSNFITALDYIKDNPEIEEKVQEDPKKYLEEKGVVLPTNNGWEITAYAGNFSLRFCLGSFCIRITIDIETAKY